MILYFGYIIFSLKVNNTVYSSSPDFSNCFKMTILTWMPSVFLGLFSPVWLIKLIKRQTIKFKYSNLFLLKLVNTFRNILFIKNTCVS